MFLRTTAIALASVLALPCHAATASDARDAFFANLGKLCGAVYEGASVAPDDGGDAFAGKKLVATVSACSASEIRIPFAVGDDTSRTWIVTRTPSGLTLQHDHRHADGSPDAQTMYGGAAGTDGSAIAQMFRADAYTARLIPAAATNVWTLSVSPDGRKLAYVLERDGKPRFRAELLQTRVPNR
ncbi:hypothetical protein HF313_23880 [Massilia atriviolacea]|uniref:Uncharacterized protein n=1 Tax=Massilia atriviolacea TaxID=2495579 RepID=A0A430HKB7_9BURK|nr:PD40 domain-containing protein [Massilia atriviolacea]RSZ57941.1 hypothetical protein EJB06_16605 [Massilia atriviolacea]